MSRRLHMRGCFWRARVDDRIEKKKGARPIGTREGGKPSVR